MQSNEFLDWHYMVKTITGNDTFRPRKLVSKKLKSSDVKVETDDPHSNNKIKEKLNRKKNQKS